ncbi:hypothetical protein KGF56_002699 [Candida oxycetoniae]|uniref:Mitochondrial group I intron splicing factor CCM1 n=1 Tax=Candida oxycetoniae TaxID=497107 RepID=A0AAI9SXG3_9ASCO|nr:uncharacterized protein KGF56_002699 [Candida oxycetoniae]KAI3404507.2 hypothetical protein KGF56_002699 [Candida oxycetoniae]
MASRSCRSLILGLRSYGKKSVGFRYVPCTRRYKSFKVIIEEPRKYENPILEKYFDEFNEYLTDPRVPALLRDKLLISKLQALIESPSDPEKLDIVTYVLNEWRKLKNFGDEEKKGEDTIPLDLAINVFETMYDQFAHSESSAAFDHLVKQLLRNLNKLPNRTLILLIDLVSQRGIDIESILLSLRDRVDEQFVVDYLDILKKMNKLNLQVFETLINMRVDDCLITNLNRYIEGIFENDMPEVHCFENMEKNLDRIQLLLVDIIAKADLGKVSIDSILVLLKLVNELAQVNFCEKTKESLQSLIDHLDLRSSELEAKILDGAIDESLLYILLFKSKEENGRLFAKIISCIDKTNTRNSLELTIVSKLLNSTDSATCHESLLEVIKLGEGKTITTSIFERISPILAKYFSESVPAINKYCQSQGIEPSAQVFKGLIDEAIFRKDHLAALKILEDSKVYVNWIEHVGDPAVAKTFNDLIQCTMSDLSIKEAFPIFKKIRAYLPTEINIDTINCMVDKMLECDLVGDVIETLKRELPKFKDEKIRLPIEQPYGYKYLNLFNKLHDYAITNTADPSAYNNWHLFINLYKYFHIPSDRVLPTLKFFCRNKRFHGALLIFNKMVHQYQLHGKHSFQPPSKEMYTYLLNEFGDNLYEEGVIEIHDWLKMDTNIAQQGLELNNVIMNAYCNLQDVAKVRDLFLSASVQGFLDETSAVTMIKAYTYNDLQYVENFWNNLSTFGLIPDYKMYRQYLIAYAYHGQTEKAFALLEEIDDYDLSVNEDLLVSLHNFCYLEDKQAEIRKVARSKYPQLWSNVEQSKMLIGTDGYRPHEHFLVDGSTKEKPKAIDQPEDLKS